VSYRLLDYVQLIIQYLFIFQTKLHVLRANLMLMG